MSKCLCGVEKGQKHEPCCPREQCPFCKDQLLGCQCWMTLFGIKETADGDPERDLTPEEDAEWERMLDKHAILFGSETGEMASKD